jgi:hypothetical protein
VQASPKVTDKELLCPECDYNLTGSTSDRCSWCGWNIDIQQLVASSLNQHTGTRLTVAGTSMLVGLFCTVGLAGLIASSQKLGWRDALAVLSVFAVIVAHFYLAYAALRTHHHWPMRAGEAANVLRLIAWGSIAASLVAATPLLSVAPSPLVVKGVQVNGVLEFIMTAAFFAMPGAMLLVLRLVSYRHKGQKPWLSKGRSDPPSGPPFSVEVDRRYDIGRLSQTWSDAPRPTTPSVEEMIARTWEVETAVAREEGRNLFNGKVGRLIGVQRSQSGLTFQLGATCYRDFLGTNLFHAAEIARLNRAYLADPLGTSALIVTRDGYIVLGLRSRKVVFHPEHLHTFGGLLEEADRTPQGYDLIRSLRRELTEELGLNEANPLTITIIGLVRDSNIRQPELILDVHVALPRPELMAMFAARHDEEHTAIEFVADDPDSILAFLRHASKATPVAQAALLLHGKHAWGTAWYENACVTLYGCHPERSEGSLPQAITS